MQKNYSAPDKSALKKEYDSFFEIRQNIVNDIKLLVEKSLDSFISHSTINGRIKDFDSYFKKHLRLLAGNEPINDLIGVRIVCLFLEDTDISEKIIKSNFEVIETEVKGNRYDFREFGYESTHLLIKIPPDILNKYGNPGIDIAEIQIRTILQEAWAQVEHEIVYKAEFNAFDKPMKRKLASVNASLVLADSIFQEIRIHQRRYSEEIGKRRESFYQKIEEATDELLFSNEQITEIVQTHSQYNNEKLIYDTGINLSTRDNVSIDDLLVSALTAHNQNRFSEAINQYSRILELNPDATVCSVIYKHRGMANFACSRYNEAILDFSKSLEYDKKSHRAAYYRGVVHSVIKDYSKAIDDYSSSLLINPHQPYCLFRRGQAYYHIGDYPQALSDCENSLSLEPANENVIKFKALVKEKLRM
jgi:putative GTP pyrophosphokinase